MEVSRYEAIYIAGFVNDFKKYCESNKHRTNACNAYCYCQYRKLKTEIHSPDDESEWLTLLGQINDDIDVNGNSLSGRCLMVNKFVVYGSTEYFELWNRHLDFQKSLNEKKEANKS